MASDHQLFEEWLFSDKDLPSRDRHALEVHLDECDSCRQLSNSWIEAEAAIKTAPMLAPAAGFSERWQMHLAADRRKKQSKQNIAILIFSAVGAATLLIVASLMFIPLFKSPWPFILTWTYQLATLYSISSVYGGALTVLVRSLINLLPPLFWVALPLTFGGLSLIWFLYYQKIILSRRIMQ